MKPILILAGLVVAWLVVRPLLRLAIATLLGDRVGKAAVARQPDTIHLVAAGEAAWRDRARADRSAGALLAAGYADAGTWTVTELPGTVVRLLVHAGDALTAAVYEHPRAGAWCEIFGRGQDGTGFTFSNLPPTGLNDRPGHPVIRRPGADALALVELSRRNRPSSALVAVTAETARARFEDAYAEAIAWRRSNGVSRAEVVNVALKRAA